MLTKDEKTYQEIVQQGNYKGLTLLIIDGWFIDTSPSEEEMRKRYFGKFPRRLKFIKKVSEQTKI